MTSVRPGASAWALRAPRGDLLGTPWCLFWAFVICSVGGLVLEEVFHFAVFGELQSRAGLVAGPFSPIYGVGGCVMALASKKCARLPLPATFCVCAVLGGAVEFLASLLMQTAFGIVAWDYTGTLLSLDGRTNLWFMLAWGALGVLCARVLVPLFEEHLAPLTTRVPVWVHAGCALLLAVDVAVTLVAFDCWFHRMDGAVPRTPVQVACAQVFDDAFMAGRFEAMTITPQMAAR